MIKGTAILYDDFVKQKEFDAEGKNWTEDDYRRMMAKQAMKNMAASQLDARKWIDGVKEHDTGVATKIMIYNASGETMRFLEADDRAGHLGAYEYDDIIQTGEWSTVLHEKTTGSLLTKGSRAVSTYRLDYYTLEHQPCVVAMGWDVPLWGHNTAMMWMRGRTVYNHTDWSTLHKMAQHGNDRATANMGHVQMHHSISQETSPVFLAVVTRSDIDAY